MNSIDINKALEGLSEEEKKAALEILKEYADTGQSQTLEDIKYADFDEIPVDIHTFLHEPMYLGKALYDADGKFTLFPYWERCLEDIFPDNITTKYQNFIMTGAIGLGKSTIAIICLLYMLYRLLCLKDPYQYYGMQPIDKLSISLMNITLENAKGVALDKMNQMILASDWFLQHGEMAGTSNLIYRPEKHIEVVLASSNNQIIGRAIFCNFTDEVNFGLSSNPEKQKAKMMKLITQLDARMKSRFMRGTYLPTLNIIASSKDTDQSFLDEYIDNKRKNNSTTTLIVDEPQWVVDSRKDSPKKFWVAIGNKLLANELPPLDVTEQQLDEYRKKGYVLWQVPIGYLETFQLNLDEAICSIIGIATASSLKYIAGTKLAEAKTTSYQNPFVKDIIEVGDGKEDFLQYSNFFDLSRVSEEDKAKPLFIHLDMSGGLSNKGGDKTGIAGVWITGKENTKNLPAVTGNTNAAMEQIETDLTNTLHYKLAFSVSVKAPKGENISYLKNCIFIRWLRDQGFAIKGVSSDTYQSTTVQQILNSDGFNTEVVTVDRVQKDAVGRPICLPYYFLKNVIYNRQITIYDKCNQLTNELLDLERKGDGHVDHPKTGCFTGDTKISLVDGREVTLLDLVQEYEAGKQNWVYSFNEQTKKIEPKPIERAWCTEKNAKLIAVELDNGEVIKCTPNHRFMLRDSSYTEAIKLTPGDSIMPLYRRYPEGAPIQDYRQYYEPTEDLWHYEHRSFATNSEILDEKYLVHHKNGNKQDNTPTNLLWCSKARHQKIRAELQTETQSVKANQKRKSSPSNYYKNNRDNPIFIEQNKKIADTLAQNGIAKHNSTAAKMQEKEELHKQIEATFNVCWAELSNSERLSYSRKYALLAYTEASEKISAELSKKHEEGCFKNAAKTLKKENELSKKLKDLIPVIDGVQFFEIFGFEYKDLPANKRAPYIVKYRKIVGNEILNHKVKAVYKLEETADVYDLTIKDNHNFALSAGVFVHNSKDAADALCGSVWLASKYTEEFSYRYGDSLSATLDANEALSEMDQKKQYIDSFEQELAQINFQSIMNNTANSNNWSLTDDSDGLIII